MMDMVYAMTWTKGQIAGTPNTGIHKSLLKAKTSKLFE